MKKMLPALLLILSCSITRAQTTEDSVKAAVNKLFTAMLSSDTALLAASFSENAVLQTIETAKDGKAVVQSDAVKDFSAAIAKIAKGDADERIQFDVLKIDADLAVVWAPYKFYYKGKFSHCGVDSFQLVRVHGVWKIQYLIDTRRKQPCEN
jgi:hypothetical protein